MKKLSLAVLAILVAQSTFASNLKIMKFDGKMTYNPAGTEKIQLISASNVGGTVLVNVVTASTICQVSVANIGEAAAIISAVSPHTTLECYTTGEKKVGFQTQILTKEIMIIKGEQ